MRLFGLIGFPLGHSFSKKYFEQKFISENIKNVDFRNFELENLKDLYQLIKENPQLEGFTVTIPHKTTILPLMDEVSDEVKQIKALNVIKIKRNEQGFRLFGYNTDIFGFEKSLLEHLLPFHRQALILGTGGSSKAVAFVLRKLGIDYKFISRNPVDSMILSYNDLQEELLNAYSLIINTTPLGMFPSIQTYPEIPYNYLTNKHFLFDLVYNPEQTLFLQKAIKQGSLVCNGYDMLRYQADEAWRIWNE